MRCIVLFLSVAAVLSAGSITAPSAVPEIDPVSAAAGLTFLSGAVAVLRARRRR